MTDTKKQVPPWKEYDSEYRAFQEREEIPVHRGLFVKDVRTAAVADWERTGCAGAFVNLTGMEGICDIHLHEIPPEEATRPQRHLHEELVFVLRGTGITSLGRSEQRQTFEWSEGALFYLPRNTRYVHTNVGTEESVRLLSVTSLPLLYTVLQDDQLIWGTDGYTQGELLAGDFYEQSTELTAKESDSRTYWEANFVPNATTFDELESWPERGGGGQTVMFPFRSTSMFAHISEFAPGRYKKAHRHYPGANVLILSGEGYSLLWKEGDEDRRRIDWTTHTLFTPPLMWFHQHFNVCSENARYIALHAPQLGIRGGENTAIRSLESANQIEYHEEDPAIRRQFQRELDEQDIENRMSPNLYEDADE